MSKTITRATAKEIGDKIKAFADSLEAEYGIEVVKRSVSYTDIECNVTIKTRISEENRGEGVKTAEESRYDMEAHCQNLPPRGSLIANDYGEEFVIDSWLPRGRKFKVAMIKTDDGKKYKFTLDGVKNAKIIRAGKQS